MAEFEYTVEVMYPNNGWSAGEVIEGVAVAESYDDLYLILTDYIALKYDVEEDSLHTEVYEDGKIRLYSVFDAKYLPEEDCREIEANRKGAGR